MIAEYAAAIRDASAVLRRNKVRISILVRAGTLLVAVSFVLRYVLGWAPGGLLLEILPGLAVEILGAILFFVLLDYGIQRIGELNLFGIREYPQLPALDFMDAVAKKAKRVVRILDTWSYLTNDPDFGPGSEVSLRTQLGTFLGGEFDKRWNDKATVSLPDFLREAGGSVDLA